MFLFINCEYLITGWVLAVNVSFRKTLSNIFDRVLNRLLSLVLINLRCVESVQIRSFFWSVFVHFHILPECGKIRTRNISVFRHFHAVSLRILSKCGKIRPEKTLYLDTFHAVLAGGLFTEWIAVKGTLMQIWKSPYMFVFI